MSALATFPTMTVALGWREPNGQIVQFGAGGGASAPSVAPAASSGGSSFSGSTGQGFQGGSGSGSNVDLFA